MKIYKKTKNRVHYFSVKINAYKTMMNIDAKFGKNHYDFFEKKY